MKSIQLHDSFVMISLESISLHQQMEFKYAKMLSTTGIPKYFTHSFLFNQISTVAFSGVFRFSKRAGSLVSGH